MESFINDSVASIPLEMICASKDYKLKLRSAENFKKRLRSAVEKDVKFCDPQAVKCYKEDHLIGARNYDKERSFKITRGYECTNNANKDLTPSCKKKEILGSQVSLGCRGNGFDCGADTASIIYDKDNPVTLLEFHASSGNGINIIVDLDASPSDLYKNLEDGICNFPSVHNSNEFQSFREELEHRFSMPKMDKEKLIKNVHTQADSIDVQFSGTVSQEKIAFCSSTRASTLNEAVPKLNLKEYDESAVLRSGVSAEEQIVKILVGRKRKRPAVIAGGKRERSSLEINLRSHTRSSQLPRRSVRLVGSKGF